MAAEDWFDWGAEEWDDGEPHYCTLSAEDLLALGYKPVTRRARKIEGMAWGKRKREQNFVEFEGVTVLAESPRALKCKFADGRVRWVPISQTPDGFEWEVGKVVTLEVSDWLVSQEDWDAEEEPEEDAVFEDVVCLRVAKSGKAIEVRVPGHDAMWIPTSQIREASEVKDDGDRGRLVISAWIAEQKDLVEGAEPRGPSVADDVRGPRRTSDDPRQQTFDDHFPPPDDDIPF